jgi:hypothetical protein
MPKPWPCQGLTRDWFRALNEATLNEGDVMEAVQIPRLQFIIMETIEEVEGPQPVAGFNMECDVAEFIRQFEASEGYSPEVYELDSEEDVYHQGDIADYR